MVILNERTRRDLEFDKVLALVQAYAASAMGQVAVARLNPQMERASIEAEFRRVKDCIAAIAAESFYVSHAPSIDQALDQAQEATTIAPEDFLPVKDALETIRLLKERILTLEQSASLKALAHPLHRFPELEGLIQRSVNEKGEIRHDASPNLRQLSKRCQTAEVRARKKLQALLTAAGKNGVIQEALITRRGGRLVVPVKRHLRHQLDGIVQGSSDSGQTLFLEPTSVVAENNLIRELEGEIRDEKLRILQALTAKLHQETPALRKTLQSYARIDSIYARAKYAMDVKAHIPALNTEGLIELKNARHPLLDAKIVVPISLSLGQKHQGMVITGPNTGGKTIALKTVGLLSLMAQAGIPIPADEGCRLALFSQVRSDIGDEQSIEQNLSTFSSHLRNIVGILTAVEKQMKPGLSLVLLDEIGAGTDPQEGTALGIALLQALLSHATRLLVTTHYSALKRFAYSDPRLKNASVEFDLETLAPTYRLLEGVPGSSNAFLIAKRLGLADELIDAAKQTLSEGEVRTEDVIRELQAEHAALDRERESFHEAKHGLEAQVRQYQQKLDQLEREHKQALSEETTRLEAELKEVRQALETALYQVRHPKDEATLKRQLNQVVQSAQTVDRTRQTLQQPEDKTIESLAALQLGQTVQVQGFRKRARVLEIVSASRIRVEIDNLRIWAKLSDLSAAKSANKIDDQPAKYTSSYQVSSSSAAPPMELNVRGMTVVETLRKVDQYLNRLLLAGREQGFILHGKGTGALRRAIRDHLRKLSWVEDAHSPPPAQGGDGVTVVKLR